jgi:hypothetical protein
VIAKPEPRPNVFAPGLVRPEVGLFYEEESHPHPEYTIPLYPQIKKPEPVYQPLYDMPRGAGYEPNERKLAYPQGYYDNYNKPNYAPWTPSDPNYYQYQQTRLVTSHPRAPYHPQPHYEGMGMRMYEDIRPNYMPGSYMNAPIPRNVNWQSPDPTAYRNPPPGFNRPMPPSNYYANPDPIGLYQNAAPFPREFIPKGNNEVRQMVNRNEFIEDFKQKLTYDKKIEMGDIKGHIIELAKDQFGSRYLQQKVTGCAPEEIKLIYSEIKEHAVQLMSDVFGNYVIQILMQKGSEEHQKLLIDIMKGKVKELSLDMYGCRCVQKAIELGTPSQKIGILDEIKPWLKEFVDNQNANHVIQICFGVLPPQHISFILDYFKSNCLSMCRHSYGCRVMQRIIEKSTLINVCLLKHLINK